MEHRHALSIDFESWIHACNNKEECLDNGFLVEAGEKILDVLKKNETEITFFVAGEVYEWYPDLVKRIREEGHEIGYHTHSHRIVTGKSVLEEEIGKSEKFLKKYRPLGFRAPQCTISSDCFSVLEKRGFRYDSSCYGPLSMARKIGNVLEIPVSTRPLLRSQKLVLPRRLTIGLCAREFPYGTGLAFSFLGSKVSYFLKNTSVFFFHPWQLYSKGIDWDRIGKSPFMKMYFKNRMGSFEKILKKRRFMKMEELAEMLGG